jgi:hypothetical protein
VSLGYRTGLRFNPQKLGIEPAERVSRTQLKVSTAG